ncbi:unnamed protein product [Sphagnum balticum]
MVQTLVQQQGLRLYTHPGTNEPPPTNVPSPVPPPDDVVHNPGPGPGSTPAPYPPPPHDQQGHPNCGPCNWISCHGTPVAPNWAALTGLNNG